MDSALAIRDYTANEILPLLGEGIQNKTSSAKRAFLRGDSEFSPASRAPSPVHLQGGDAESDESARSSCGLGKRHHSAIQERCARPRRVGERDTPMGKSLIMARPIRNEAECSQCHSTCWRRHPELSLPAMAATTASAGRPTRSWVPRSCRFPASAAANADRAFRAFMISLAAVFAAVFVVVNAVLYNLLVVRPVSTDCSRLRID